MVFTTIDNKESTTQTTYIEPSRLIIETIDITNIAIEANKTNIVPSMLSPLVPREGLEPPRLSALVPKTSESTQFHHRGKSLK